MFVLQMWQWMEMLERIPDTLHINNYICDYEKMRRQLIEIIIWKYFFVINKNEKKNA